MIGPTFAAEIASAGLAGLPFSWTATGVEGRERLAPAQQATLDAVIAAHDPSKLPPPPPRVVPADTLIAALTASGKLAAMDAAVSATAKDKDRLYWHRRYEFVESNPKLIRLATAAAVDLGAAFTLAATL